MSQAPQQSPATPESKHGFSMLKAALVLPISLCIILLNLVVGSYSSPDTQNLVNLIAEGAVALMVLAWVIFILKARLEGEVERYLFIGFILIYIGYLQEALNELLIYDGQNILIILLGDISIPLGTLSTSIGFMLWSNKQAKLYKSTNEQKIKYETLSLVDELTQVGNTRAFHKSLDEQIQYAATNNEALSIAMLDLDHFKSLNDNYGHQAGDDVLAYFGALLRIRSRTKDQAFRYGGEEFTLIMPNTGIDDAKEALERIRQKLEEQKFNFSHHKNPVQCTVSIGVASLEPGESSKQLLKRADQAVYEAKTQNRNQVVAST